MNDKTEPDDSSISSTGNIRVFSATWVMPISSDPVHKGAVAVEGDTILAVGAVDEIKAAYPGAEVTDFHHTIILPGFVNCHSHLEYAVFRGLLDNKNFGPWMIDFIDQKGKLSRSDYEVSAMLGASECVSSGVTTVGDSMYSRTSMAAIGRSGIRARAYQEVFGLDDNKISETMARLQDVLEELEEEKSELTEIGIFPHATYTVSASLYHTIAEFARARGMKMATHLAESKEESVYIRSGSGILALDLREKVGWDYLSHEPFGVTPVKYLQQWNVYGSDFMAVHCVHVAPPDIQALARYDVAVAHCPKSNAKLGCGIAPLPAFLRAGIRVGFGTDSPASSNIMDMFGEMRTAIFLHRGVEHDAGVLGAAECVQLATLGGARALGMEDRIGSLESGKQADMIAVDMEYSHFTPIHDPYSALVYGANQEDVFFTMVAGRPLYTRKVLVTLDDEEITAKAREAEEKLWS